MSLHRIHNTTITANENIIIFDIIEKVMEESLEEFTPKNLSNNGTIDHQIFSVKVNY